MRIVLALLLTILAGCAGGRRSVTIFHTNDIHGRFVPERASWRADSADIGGFAALSGALDSLRAVHENSIYLDAGDVMTGNPICDFEVSGVKGGALQHLLDLCGLDAQCLGNHEFDLGAEHLRDFIGAAPYPLLCANLTDKRDGRALCAPYTTVQSGNISIGIVGLILNDLAEVVSSDAVAPFSITDISTSAQNAIDELDPRTDLIILLTHNGLEEDKLLARAVHGADIIVGGHSHTRLTEPIRENGVILVQAGSYCKNLGELTVQVAGDSVSNFKGDLIELEAGKFASNSQVEAYCDSFATVISRVYGEVIAEAAEAITRSYDSSSPLGNLLCDLLREHYACDIAFVNSGGLRKDIAAGPVTKLDCVELMPFTNSVCRFTVTGAELRQLALLQAKSQSEGKSEVLQMSGLEIAYLKSADEIVLSRVLVNGEEIVDSREYTAVSIDYVLRSQWEKYLGFQPRELDNTGMLFSDFIMLAFRQSEQPIRASHELRLHEEIR